MESSNTTMARNLSSTRASSSISMHQKKRMRTAIESLTDVSDTGVQPISRASSNGLESTWLHLTGPMTYHVSARIYLEWTQSIWGWSGPRNNEGGVDPEIMGRGKEERGVVESIGFRASVQSKGRLREKFMSSSNNRLRWQEYA